MKYLLAIALILGSGLALAKARGPYITSDEPGVDRCTEDDPLGPCRDRVIHVKNPSKWAQEVEITCGPGILSNVKGTVVGHQEGIFIVSSSEIPGGLRQGQCQILTVRRYQ
jgi:hypothetical protein